MKRSKIIKASKDGSLSANTSTVFVFLTVDLFYHHDHDGLVLIASTASRIPFAQLEHLHSVGS